MKNTCSNPPTVAVLLFNFYPFASGGMEKQAHLLLQTLAKQNLNGFIITRRNKNLPKFECYQDVEIYRFFSFFKEKQTKKDLLQIDYINEKESQYKKNDFSILNILIQIHLIISLAFKCFALRKKFNVIYIPTLSWFTVAGCFIANMLNKKVVINDSTMNGFEKLTGTPFKKQARYFLSKNCMFVAKTSYIESVYLQYHVPAQKIIKIPNGIKINAYSRTKKSFDYRVLFVGNLFQQPAKGIDVLLYAWKKIIAIYPQAVLTLLGAGDVESYRNFSEKLKVSRNVVFTVSISPERFYENSDVFVLPSRREGMSNALMEAMLYELPVIATRISGNEDLIDHIQNGLLIQPNSIDNLVEAIEYVFKNHEKSKDMGKNARLTIEQKCDINMVAEHFADLFISQKTI